MPRAGEVLHAWRRWIRGVSEQTTSCGRLLQFPPLPELPPPLRGQAFVVVEVVHQGAAAELDAAISALRALGPVMDTIGEISNRVDPERLFTCAHPVMVDSSSVASCQVVPEDRRRMDGARTVPAH